VGENQAVGLGCNLSREAEDADLTPSDFDAHADAPRFDF
jgi:hypothetical protein